MSKKGHYSCSCCGWSNYTTYQGLRVHQGKMGCTPKGLSIPQSQYSSLYPSYSAPAIYKPAISYTPPENYSYYESPKPVYRSSTSHNASSDTKRTAEEDSLQTCHCGWSKVTSYQGLRIHQGRMGCTPKGLGIPADLHPLFSSSTKGNDANTPKPAEKYPSHKSVYETPQRSSQSFTGGNTTRRALDFSSSELQIQMHLGIPTTLSQEAIMQVKAVEKEMEIKREAAKQLQLQKDMLKAKIQDKIHSGRQKLVEVQSSVKACEGRLYAQCLEINNVFSDVIQVVEDARKKALQPLENRRAKLERDGKSLIQRINEDIQKLETAIQEVDSAAELDVASLEKIKTRDFSKLNVDTSFSFGTLQTNITTMMEQIQQELKKISALELQRAPSFAVDVKLDPTTAHQCLTVSKDGKKVQDGGQSQQVLMSPGRFDVYGSILGVNKFTSGKSYWEVEVGSKSGWDLGVASAKANRKGKLTLKPDNGYWAIVHYEGDKYAALTAPPVCLELDEQPQKVGVFLDYDEGLVSFYNVTTETHIHSFTKCCFSDEIFPYFSPHLKQNGTNSEPLVISQQL